VPSAEVISGRLVGTDLSSMSDLAIIERKVQLAAAATSAPAT